METANMKGIPAMSPPVVHDYIRDLGRAWTGQGTAMEVGCWLGATSAALLEGLVEAGYDRTYWGFDRWQANEAEARKAAEQGVNIGVGQNLQPMFMKNVKARYEAIQAVRGNIPRTLNFYSPAEPIEICMFDAPKRNPTFIDSINMLLPHFIPGVTVLGLLDYHFYISRRDDQQKEDWEKFLAPVNFIRKYKENFELMAEFPNDGSCAFFKYLKPI